MTSSRTHLRAAAVSVAALAALAAGGCSNTTTTAPAAQGAGQPSAAPARAAAPDAAAIVAHLKAAGLPVTHVTTFTAESDPKRLLGRQGQYTGKTSWIDPAAQKSADVGPQDDPGGAEHGGVVETFAAGGDAQARLSLLKSYQPPLGDGYDTLQGLALLRLGAGLTPAQAARYQAAFKTAAG